MVQTNQKKTFVNFIYLLSGSNIPGFIFIFISSSFVLTFDVLIKKKLGLNISAIARKTDACFRTGNYKRLIKK